MDKKVALITGASSGIGKACAEAFAAEGCSLVIIGRNAKALDETKAKCIHLGVKGENVLTIVADLSKDEETKAVVGKVSEKFKRLDILVNSAGILQGGSTEAVSMEDYDNQMNINVRAPFFLTKLCIPLLLEAKGSVVNISSVAGLRAFPGVVAYNMSKAAMDQFTRTLALELADRGVRVNAVNPGVVVTECHKRSGMDYEAYQKFLEHSKTTHAMGRVAEASEVASAVVFLASDKASFITGVTLSVDGGRAAMCPR